MQILKDQINSTIWIKFFKELVDNITLKKLIALVHGTVYLHSGNVVHRFNPEPGSDRLVTHLIFSGSNILMNTKGIVKSLKTLILIKFKKKLNIIINFS